MSAALPNICSSNECAERSTPPSGRPTITVCVITMTDGVLLSCAAAWICRRPDSVPDSAELDTVWKTVPRPPTHGTMPRSKL